ncbi:hypothetical protein [Flavicella sediminum]|uniref:hypothetical protein n=1 Tax=Flavicella sediminum TaxID=2585141 RepID=UPI00112466D3|nr:hypothetical protein [Flavicella sediminum]
MINRKEYDNKLNFIIIVWIFFLGKRVFLSGSIDLMYYLASNKAVDFESFPIFSFFKELILIMKYIGLISSFFVIINFKRKIFYPIFIFSLFYFCFAFFQLIGTYGIWAFYFIPCSILYLSMYSTNKKMFFKLLVFSYCTFYFYAGYSKIYPFWKFDDWINGYTIENLIFSRMHESILYQTFGINILELPELLIKIFIILSVFLELGVIIICYKYYFHKVIIPLVLSFHLFLFLTGTPGIVEYTIGAAIFIPNSIVTHIINIKNTTKNYLHKTLGNTA